MSVAQFGERPVMVGPESDRAFVNYSQAAIWLVGASTEKHEVSRLFIPRVTGELEALGGGGTYERLGAVVGARITIPAGASAKYQRLNLKLSEPRDMRGGVERYYHGVADGGVTVTELDEGFLDLHVVVDSLNDIVDGQRRTVFANGLAQVRVSASPQPVFHTVIEAEHGVKDPGELAYKLTSAHQMAVRLVDGIVLNSTVIQELARGDAG